MRTRCQPCVHTPRLPEFSLNPGEKHLSSELLSTAPPAGHQPSSSGRKGFYCRPACKVAPTRPQARTYKHTG